MTHLMDKKWWFFILSFLVIIPGLVSLSLHRLRLSIDFTGGTVMEYKLGQEAKSEDIQSLIKNSGVTVASIRTVGANAYRIKTNTIDDKKISEIKNKLTSRYQSAEQLDAENISPVISSEVTRNALVSLGISSLFIVLYIAFSFRKVPKPASSLRFGIAAIVALLHDVLVVLGVFSILGYYYGVEVDVLFITALLTIIGFSVHDTIVVFDRIRENLPKHLSKNFTEVANISIAQTLGRSLNTSLTVVFVLLAMLLFGGESIKWFIVALLVGIVSGTFSSIFNATAVLALWEEKLGH